MTEIKRHNAWIMFGKLEMVEDQQGEWVKWDDVKHLVANAAFSQSQRKTIKIAPALHADGFDKDLYRISPYLYVSEEQARERTGKYFLRWLIDTPYAVEVEVSE
jgi:hypothetical protein